jgi:hypothetical protein
LSMTVVQRDSWAVSQIRWNVGWKYGWIHGEDVDKMGNAPLTPGQPKLKARKFWVLGQGVTWVRSYRGSQFS